jgi:hypothetical protein
MEKVAIARIPNDPNSSNRLARGLTWTSEILASVGLTSVFGNV